MPDALGRLCLVIMSYTKNIAAKVKTIKNGYIPIAFQVGISSTQIARIFGDIFDVSKSRAREMVQDVALAPSAGRPVGQAYTKLLRLFPAKIT